MKYPTKSSIGGRALGCLILLVFGGPALGNEGVEKDYAPYPNPDDGYVTDLAGLLSNDREQQIERWLYEAEKSNGVEMIVVTIDSIRDYPGAPNRDIETFARSMFDAYGIGNMPKNDGVLLLVARRDRKVRIELGGGYGHARDRDANRIIQKSILPSFRKDEYESGITRGVRSLLREFGGVILLPRWLPWLLGGVAVGLVAVAISLFRNGKRGWGWVVVGLIIVILLVVIWIGRRLAEQAREGGLGGGGLGGFGGGFSGGGGATGSW